MILIKQSLSNFSPLFEFIVNVLKLLLFEFFLSKIIKFDGKKPDSKF